MKMQNAQIGPYTFIGKLGSGNSGQVRLAINTKTQQNVAIKIINKQNFVDHPQLQTKIQREIALMHLADNPHLLKLIDVLESPRHLYIVIEYAEKGELFNYLVEHRRLDENQAMMFFRQIIYGLEYLHSLGICHRDLKPENILLDANLNVKIADFGFARFVKTSIAETSCGSPHYAAPEVIAGQPYDGRCADIWSCGVILFALLAGYLPFDDQSIRGLLSKVKRGLYQMPSSFSEGAKNFISNILVVDPTKRLTISGMKMHPFFRLKLPFEYVLPSPLPFPSFLEPINPETIPSDIIDVFHKIGYQKDDELFADLTSNQHTMAKVFYFMLTGKPSLENLDWSQAFCGSLQHQVSPDDIMYEMNSFSQYEMNSFNLTNSRSVDLSTSLASRAEWAAIQDENNGPETISTFSIIANMSHIYALLAVQRLVKKLDMQWFHNDDFVIIARKDNTYIVIQCLDILNQEKIKIDIEMYSGSVELFNYICQCAEEIINQMNSIL